jgi:glycosyltransferase involved in cell wall biosynthesis
MPLISVIIPTRNRAALVGEAVESVLAQTFSDRELLVVDDGSSDNTEEVLDRFRGRLRYVRTPPRGVSAARNLGVRLCGGEWIGFLDSDDLWLPRKLERQMGVLGEKPQHPLCYTDEIWIRDGVRVNPRNRHRKYSGWIFERCLPLCIISPSSALIGRETLERVGGFDEDLPVCEDYDLWLRITLRFPVRYLEEKLIVKRGGHADQLSRSVWGMDRFRVRALTRILEEKSLAPTQREAVREQIRAKCGVLAAGARKRGRSQEFSMYERIAATGRWEERNEGKGG